MHSIKIQVQISRPPIYLATSDVPTEWKTTTTTATSKIQWDIFVSELDSGLALRAAFVCTRYEFIDAVEVRGEYGGVCIWICVRKCDFEIRLRNSTRPISAQPTLVTRKQGKGLWQEKSSSQMHREKYIQFWE